MFPTPAAPNAKYDPFGFEIGKREAQISFKESDPRVGGAFQYEGGMCACVETVHRKEMIGMRVHQPIDDLFSIVMYAVLL